MTKTLTVTSGLLSLAALTLAGCGAKPVAQTDNTTTTVTNKTTVTKTRFDPCSVLTGDEVAAITTETVTHTRVSDNACVYLTDIAGDDDGTQIAIAKSDAAGEMRSIREANKMLGGIGGAVSAQGAVGKDVQAAITPPAAGDAPKIGDESVWLPNQSLAVRKGEVFVQVTPPLVRDPAKHLGMLFSDADKRGISQKLAEAALAKLTH
jgi:hypothetical protein